MSELTIFKYKNHRGEVAVRSIIPEGIEWLGNPGFDYKPGWFLTGFDVDKQARRSFSLENIIIPQDKNGVGATFYVLLDVRP